MSLRIEKGSVLAVVWDTCAEPFKKRTSQESILFPVGLDPVVAGFSLTVGRLFATVGFPKYLSKVSDTFSTLPRGGRTFVRKSIVIKRPAGGVSAGGDFVHIGGNASSVFREGTAAFDKGRGKQVLPPLCV